MDRNGQKWTEQQPPGRRGRLSPAAFARAAASAARADAGLAFVIDASSACASANDAWAAATAGSSSSGINASLSRPAARRCSRNRAARSLVWASAAAAVDRAAAAEAAAALRRISAASSAAARWASSGKNAHHKRWSKGKRSPRWVDGAAVAREATYQQARFEV